MALTKGEKILLDEIKKMDAIADEVKEDRVNKPAHYTQGGIETIDNMLLIFGEQKVLDYCMMNAYKYLSRHKFKNGAEDVLKAKWYLDYAAAMNLNVSLYHSRYYSTLVDILEKASSDYAWSNEDLASINGTVKYVDDFRKDFENKRMADKRYDYRD